MTRLVSVALPTALLILAGCSTSDKGGGNDRPGPEERAAPRPGPKNDGPRGGNASIPAKDAPSTTPTPDAVVVIPPGVRPTFGPATTASPTPATAYAPSFVVAPRKELAARKAEGLKLLWVSLDGLKRADLEKYAKTLSSPHPKGFTWLLARDKRWAKVRITNPTITASSHASTITCAPPGVHGIVANGQWNGETMESGFDKPYPTETFVSALRKQGVKVGVMGYPGFDGTTQNRTANFAVAYDNSPVRAQFVALEDGEAKPFELASRVSAGVKYAFRATWHADKGEARVDLGDGNTTEISASAWTTVTFVEQGVTQMAALRVFRRTLDAAPMLYVAPVQKNNAYPAALRDSLDGAGMVFSAGKDYRVRSEFGDRAFLETMKHRLEYFGRTTRAMLSRREAQAFFLYFEDLDVLGHQYAGDASADALRAEHFAKLDAALGSIMELVPSSTAVLMVGDHGMSAIDYELNAGAFVASEAKDKLLVKASGGAVFLYGKDKSSLTSNAPVGEAWFDATLAKLKEARLPTDPSKPLFPRVVVRGSAEAKAEGWQDATTLPWVMAFATPGVALKESTETGLLLSKRKSAVLPDDLLAQAAGGDSAKLSEPVPYGQHGHVSTAEAMLTDVVLFGPRFRVPASRLPAKVSNLALVPFAADAFGWSRPEACAKGK